LEPLNLTIEAWPRVDRLHAWHDTLGRLGLRAVGVDGSRPLHGTVRSQVSAGGFGFALLSSVAQTLKPAASPAEGLFVILSIDGGARFDVDGAHERVETGDLVLMPPQGRAVLRFESAFRALVVQVPRTALAARLPASASSWTARVTRDAAVGRVFSDLLRSIAESIDALAADDLRPLEVALTGFIATSVATQQREARHDGLTSAQAALFARVCSRIDARLGDPELSLAQIAREERVSARYLQKLFEAVGQSFSTWLRMGRLERCRADLVDPLYEKMSISDICFRWGFNDHAHFSRAFRERYHTTPSAFRHEAGLELANQLAPHLSRGLPVAADSTAASRERRVRRSDPQDDADIAVARAPAVPHPAPANRRLARPRHHLLRASANSVHWGYFSHDLKPVLEVDSGDTVTIETLTQHASDDWMRMVAGDPGAESVFHWTPERKNVNRRGAGPLDASIYGRGAGEGFGVHICTGPIAVRGAEPGDVLEVKILDVRARHCANPQFRGRAFGSNAAAWWGFHYRELLTEPKPREVITIYELDTEPPSQRDAYARAVYNYRWTPQRDPFGVLHPTIDYPGVPVDPATIVENHGILAGVRIPVRPHFGVIGVAPQQDGLIDSIPPSSFGGNLDNWRVGRGASVYLPVGVAGALLSVGDPHASQGDSELCGTAIECSLTGDFRLTLHKRETLARQPYADLTYPLVETDDEWVLQGFSHANYLAEFGAHAQSKVYETSTLDMAMRDAFIKTRRFLMTTRGLSEDEAISLMSVAVDFGVTQVVDGNWGVHAIIRKALFTN
jgi:acetamidase/formamidase/AraC-like DNA-binding protein